MVPELRSWVQFPLATQFFTARILPSLASSGPVGTAAPEREQANSRGSHVGGGMLDYSIIGLLTPSISPRFYGLTGRGGAV
jgi:hypothetical protein